MRCGYVGGPPRKAAPTRETQEPSDLDWKRKDLTQSSQRTQRAQRKKDSGEKDSGEKDRSPESLRGEAEYLVGGGGGDGNAHVFQAGACDAFFLGPRITLDDFTKFPDAGIFLAHFNEALALS